MKLLAFPLAVFLVLSAFADPAPGPQDNLPPGFPQLDQSSTAWSVVGTWHGIHRDWTGFVSFLPDGTIADGSGKFAGHWTLLVQRDKIVLVLMWKDWPIDIATMISSDEFHGPGVFDLRRVPPAPPVSATVDMGTDAAAKWQTRANGLHADPDNRKMGDERLRLYTAKQPYRETSP